MKFCGFKLSRFREARGAIVGGVLNGGPLVLLKIGMAAIRSVTKKPVNRAEWRKRVKACNRCLIYNPNKKICKRGELGCGCYIPLKARIPTEDCWTGKGWD